MNESERIVDRKSFEKIALAADDEPVRPLDALDGILGLVDFFHSDRGQRIARSHVDYYAHRQMTVDGGNLPLSVGHTLPITSQLMRDEPYEAEGKLLTRGWLHLFDEMVGKGTVYVTPRMVKIISDLANDLPEDPVLRETDIPFDLGTVWLGAPVTLGEYAEKNRVPIRVIAWTTKENVSRETESGDIVEGHGVTTLSFMKGTEVLEVNLEARGFANPDPETGRTASQIVREERLDWIPWETQAWAFGESWLTATPEETERFSDRAWTREDAHSGKPEPEPLPYGVKPEEVAVVRRFLFVLWRLMTEEVAVPVDYRPERQAQRRVERSKRPELAVRVIHLRRLYDPAVTLTEEEKLERKRLDRVWSHRWRVRTHWRRQPYGPRGSGLYRMVEIESYVKGPEDKPLVEKPTVWSLER